MATTHVAVTMDTVPALLIATSVLVSIPGVHSVSFLPRICGQKLCSLFVDVNECSTGNGGCGHTCTNTIGSYYCSCDPGYRLGDNRLRCHSELMEWNVLAGLVSTLLYMPSSGCTSVGIDITSRSVLYVVTM